MKPEPIPAAADPGRDWELVEIDDASLPLVAAVERSANDHPWGTGHFRDSVASGYWVRMLVTVPLPDDPPDAPRLADGRLLLGYIVAMRGVDEVHLLNIATAPMLRRRGCARLMLGMLEAWSLLQQAGTLWLEVRAGNAAARSLYESLGYRQVGLRRGYYPAQGQAREDAIVMSKTTGAEVDR